MLAEERGLLLPTGKRAVRIFFVSMHAEARAAPKAGLAVGYFSFRTPLNGRGSDFWSMKRPEST